MWTTNTIESTLRTHGGFWANGLRIGNSYLDSIGSNNHHLYEKSVILGPRTPWHDIFSEKTSDFDVYEDDTIAACKQKAAEQFSIIGSQRWFCRGGILSDIMTVKQCKIPENFVIQIIVQQVTAETKHLWSADFQF